jgi:hypothetical protein
MNSLDDSTIFMVTGIDGHGTYCNDAQPDGTRAGPVAFPDCGKALDVAHKYQGNLVEMLLSVAVAYCQNAGLTLYIHQTDQLIAHPDNTQYLTKQRLPVNMIEFGDNE